MHSPTYYISRILTCTHTYIHTQVRAFGYQGYRITQDEEETNAQEDALQNEHHPLLDKAASNRPKKQFTKKKKKRNHMKNTMTVDEKAEQRKKTMDEMD
jgi:hypothetical protein